jgi:D-alanyl-D-alanine carboxypeptidase
MYNDALAKDILLTPCSGYNSYHRQIEVYNEKVSVFVNNGYTNENAMLEAAKRVGKPCCNESGAGLSVGIKQMSADFATSKEYAWLIENAHNYGFVLRYPEDKTSITGMTYQPWLWRYVGVEAATEMKEKNLCLEEYLGYIKFE